MNKTWKNVIVITEKYMGENAFFFFFFFFFHFQTWSLKESLRQPYIKSYDAEYDGRGKEKILPKIIKIECEISHWNRLGGLGFKLTKTQKLPGGLPPGPPWGPYCGSLDPIYLQGCLFFQKIKIFPNPTVVRPNPSSFIPHL